MSLGVVARADQSGLAQLCEQVIDRLHPERILVVSLGHLNRGHHDPHRYDVPGRRVFHAAHPGGFTSDILGGFLGGLTHVWTAETWYDRALPEAAVSYGVRRHLYAMPELYNGARPELKADQLWLPCALGPNDGRRWRAGVLPWWTPDVTPHVRHESKTVTFVHPTGQAMVDRNGTASVMAAAAHMNCQARIVIVGNQQHFGDRCQVGNVEIVRVERVDHWTDLYALGDVLVLPRRYGWLSLPMFEAAAYGMPVITTDVWPQNEWFRPFGELLTSTVGTPHAVNMKGGSTLIWTADPRDVAAAMDLLAAHPTTVLPAYQEQFRAWAEGHAWPTVEHEWKQAFA